MIERDKFIESNAGLYQRGSIVYSMKEWAEKPSNIIKVILSGSALSQVAISSYYPHINIKAGT